MDLLSAPCMTWPTSCALLIVIANRKVSCGAKLPDRYRVNDSDRFLDRNLFRDLWRRIILVLILSRSSTKERKFIVVEYRRPFGRNETYMAIPANRSLARTYPEHDRSFCHEIAFYFATLIHFVSHQVLPSRMF